MRYLVPGSPPCPGVVTVSYIRQAEVLTLFSVEGEAQVKRQNTVVKCLTANLGAKHWEILGEGIVGTKANAGVNVASQATPSGLGIGKEGREGISRRGEAGIVHAELVLMGEGESGHDIIAGHVLREPEGWFTQDGAQANPGQQNCQGDRRHRWRREGRWCGHRRQPFWRAEQG